MADTDPVHLVLLFKPGVLDPDDYLKIARRVRAVANDVEVFIHEDRAPKPALLERLASRRTFVFSPTQITAFVVRRGRVYAGRPMRKSEQLLRLQLAGLPVPAWSALDRAKRFEPAYWGDWLVLKPEIGSESGGVTVVRTRDLNDAAATAEQYSRERNNQLVQKIVYNRAFGKIRIQTLFDEVLFARLFRFPAAIRFDSDADMQAYQSLFQSQNNVAENYESAEVFALAKRAFRAFDGAALLGLDVLIDEGGRPFFIEANPGGNTWHFSSALVGQMLRARGRFLEEQFNAFELAGDVLARRALAEAV